MRRPVCRPLPRPAGRASPTSLVREIARRPGGSDTTRRKLAALAFTLVALVAGTAPASAAGEDLIPVVITFAQRPSDQDLASIRGAGGRVEHRYGIVPAVAAAIPERAVATLVAHPGVRTVEPDQVVRAFDYRSTHDWGIGHIRAADVHAAGNTGGGVTVAIIDSGVDCGHAELPVTRCAYGYDYVNGDTVADDDWGHGTHVAGTVAATRDNVGGSGVAGAAPTSAVLAYKILDDQGYGATSDVIAAIDDIWNGGSPKAPVVNMSLGWSSGSSTFQAAMDRAYASGMLLLAAAGNGGSCSGRGNSVSYPAKYDSVVAVAAVDSGNARPCWSSTGEQVELAAPGVSIFSTWPSDLATSYRDPQPVCEEAACHYKFGSGTSMSVPHAAGAAALVLASADVTDGNGNGLADEVRSRLQSTALDLGSSGRDPLYGFGLLDASSATQSPTPGDGGSGGEVSAIALSVSGTKVKGLQKADLAWSGATGTQVDVHRDGVLITTTPNDGAHRDHIDVSGKGSYVYKVCEAGTSTCSNDATVSFG